MSASANGKTEGKEAEVAGGKTGVDLFRELMRLYPVAEVEDYYKMGTWKNDWMRVDYLLVSAHRTESGAPDPIPLEKIPVPTLPQAPQMIGINMGMGGWSMPKAPMGGCTGKAAPTPTTVSPPPELKAMALFIAKNKLDPGRAKTALQGLQPQEREAVFNGFSSDASGVQATDELEVYIKDCKDSGLWKDLPKPEAPAGGTGKATPLTPGAVTLCNAGNAGRLDIRRIFIFGRSLGGAVAVALAHELQESVKGDETTPRPCGIILENTFVSISAVVDALFPLLAFKSLKARFLRLRWETVNRIATVQVPFLFLTGEKDEMIPPWHSRHLHQQAKLAPMRRQVVFPEGSHNDTWERGGDLYWQAQEEFITDCSAGDFSKQDVIGDATTGDCSKKA